MALSEILSPFQWAPGGEKLTPAQIAARLTLEEALMQRGDPAFNNAGWLGAVGRGLEGVYAGMSERRSNAAERQNAERSRTVGSELMSAVFGGGARNTFPAAPGGMSGQAPQAAANPNAGSTVDFARASAPAGGNSWLNYANSGATRNQPINPNLEKALGFLPELGVTMEVFSGGQPAKGSGLARVGSTRHDHGNAADVFFYKDGRRLDWANEQDRPLFQEIVRRSKAAGVTGFGAGPGYMQQGDMHLGFGNPGVWGAGGSGRNAPSWLTEAYNGQPGAAPAQSALESMAVGQSMPSPLGPGSDGEVRVGPTGQNVKYIGGQGGAPGEWGMTRDAGNSAPPAALGRNPMSGNVDVAQAAPDMGQAFSDAMLDPYVSPEVRKVAEALFQQQMQQRDPSYQLDMDYKRAQIEKMQREAAGGGENVYGTPIYGRDPQSGQTVLGVIGKDGTFKRLDTGGVEVTPGVTWQDMGTYRQGFDKSGAPVTPQVAKENYQEAFDTGSGTADAKTAAEKRAGLPQVEQQANIMLSTIDGLLSHPGLSSAVGWQGNIPDAMIPGGTQAADFMSLLDQINGQAFLQAFESLKGAGQITEIEGQKATQAISRLRRGLSEAEFKRAAQELRGVVQTGLGRARKAAGGGSSDGWQDLGDGVRIRRLD